MTESLTVLNNTPDPVLSTPNSPFNLSTVDVSQVEPLFIGPDGQRDTADDLAIVQCGATGTNVFGINLAGDYSLTVGSFEYLTTGAIDCSGFTQVSLKFQRFLNSDYQTFVYQTLEASADGASWSPLWDNGTSETADSAWSEQVHDISAVADGQSTVFLSWGHQVAASGAWAYSGWNVDDVEIWGLGGTTPPASTITASFDCTPNTGQLPFVT
ncbi:MAG: hypothetical protein GY773_09215, partial [Actinomycetia bacterium]|nr:hypothetical protein [Actinomycetes bacterium]